MFGTLLVLHCCQSTTEVKPAEEVVEREVEQQAGGGHGVLRCVHRAGGGSWEAGSYRSFLLFISSLPCITCLVMTCISKKEIAVLQAVMFILLFRSRIPVLSLARIGTPRRSRRKRKRRSRYSPANRIRGAVLNSKPSHDTMSYWVNYPMIQMQQGMTLGMPCFPLQSHVILNSRKVMRDQKQVIPHFSGLLSATYRAEPHAGHAMDFLRSLQNS